MEENTEYENYKKRMEKFPCAFNLVGSNKVTTTKFRTIQHNLVSELDINDNCENERIIKLNMLTWVRFRLENQDEAVQLSNEAVDSTERGNIASLGNRFFVMWQTGDESEATKCLKDLENMESEQGFDTRLTDAQAEQAYYYSRLGGPNNLQRAIQIYSALPETPINYLRKFGCGLVYHRITHVNIFCSSSESLPMWEYQQRAVECLFEVAENANSRLRSLAYAQLVNLPRRYPFDLPPRDQASFRGLGVVQLCQKALEHGEGIPTVLAQCGKAMKPINIDKAIEWLKKAVEIKENSAAYHHLGICYKRKAEQAAKGNPCPQNTSEELHDHGCMGQHGAERHVTVQRLCQSHDMSRTSRGEDRRPADGNTVYHSANSATMHVVEEDPQVNYKRNCGSNRHGNRNYLPKHMGGRYGQDDYQIRQTSNRHGEINYQHLPTNFQYQQINEQRGYLVDKCGYLSHRPSQVKYTRGNESYYSSQMNYTHTEMNHRPLDISQLLGQTYDQPAYMRVGDGQWDNENVQVGSAGCVNYNVENYRACGSMHDEAVAGSMPSVYSYGEAVAEIMPSVYSCAENHEVWLSGPISDSENYYIEGNIRYQEQNIATVNNPFTYPMLETQTGSVQRVPDMPFHLYDYSQYNPVASRISTHESQRPGWGAPKVAFRSDIAGNMCSTLWKVGRITDVQNMRGRRWNTRSRDGFRESCRITSCSHCNSPDATSNFGSSRRSIDGRRRSARGIGLVRGNTQRMGRHVRNNNPNGRPLSGGGWELKPRLKDSLRRCRSVIPLNKDDENVQEAIKYFKKAIDIAKENVPASLDLGLLLKDTNQVDEALKQFNNITYNYNPFKDHRLTVISAFEQAGLCYLKLSQVEGKADYKEMAKNKLTKAVSMAADLALIKPELQGSHTHVWIAFTTLLAEIDKERVPYNRQIKQKMKVLELAREYGDIVDVIQKLKDTGHEELTNPDIIKTALDSYLKLGQPDNALGYHNLVSMNPAVKGSDWWNANPMRSLRIKVLLYAISERLREISDSPTLLFQQLFELVFGSCFGLHDPENHQQNNTVPMVLGDVLFVFDTDDSPDEEIRCPVVKAARCLKMLNTCLFGLETQENLMVRKFPCTFNLESVEQLTLSRLRYIKHNLVSELHIGNDAEEEIIRKKNLLTLVLFRLGDRNTALEVNDEVVRLTKWANIASLGNRCFIMVSIGDEPEAKRCLSRLTGMRKSDRKYFDGLLTEALAEQGYCYSRFGGTENLRLAISLFTLVVTQRPDNFLWKFGLGLVYRRATHTNIYCSSTDRLDVQGFQALAVEHLFDVGENADSSNLRAMAYAQLMKIRQDHASGHVPHCDNLFRNNSIEQLCNMALHYGKDIPSVLTQCGRSLIPVDLDRAVKLLAKSVSIKRNTIAYHYLGICYKKQAELQAQTMCLHLADVTKKEVKGPHCPSEKLIQSQREFMRSISCDCTPEVEISSLNVYTDRLRGFYSNTAPHTVQQADRYKEKHRTLGNKYNQVITDSWRPQDEVKAFVANSDMTVPLNTEDKCVKSAIWCFKRAIEISNGENLPAILDLGIILKQTGQLREALTQFNSVTNSQLSLTGHRVTVISAYEQSGLCYLELSKLDGDRDNFQQEGIKKLTKAITLAADLATTLSELKGCAHEIWLALKTLLSELDKVPQFADQQKQKIRLLELVRDHGQIVEVVQKLREVNENDLADPDVIQSALVSYLELGQPENALAFLNMVGLQRDIQDLDWWKDNQMRLIRIKVLLHAIMGRLIEGNQNPAYLFQQLFKLCYGSCVGMDVRKEQKTTVRNKTGDILFVYDDDQETEAGLSSTMKMARLLSDLSSVFFGLEVSENLQGTGEYGERCSIQLKEMLKYQVVIIVLGDETRNRLFNAMLERVSYNKREEAPPNQKILVIDAGLPGGNIPQCLQQFKSLKLGDIGILGQLQTAPESWGGSDHISFTDIINHVDVDAVLKLFCFMIEQTWPWP